MPLVILDKACLAFGHHPLLDHADLVLDAGERVGLIGRNGTGKSSLLKIIAAAPGAGPADAKLDDGSLWLAPDARVAFVAQEPELDPDHTIYEAVAEGLGEVRQLIVDYHAVSHALSEPGADTESLLKRLQALQGALEGHDGWRVHTRVETVLSKLSLPADTRVGALSGGWVKRVALARALVAAPDLLLLDEPTNHLDVAAIEWLESLLTEFAGCVLFITHDRRFLDNVATRIVELDRGRLTSYATSTLRSALPGPDGGSAPVGAFSQYQARKAEQLEVEAVHNEKFDKFLAQEEVWIRKGVEARRTRNEGRVRRLEALRRERVARRDRLGRVSLSLEQGERSGKLVAELVNVTKSFGGKTVIGDFSTRIQRGDKIGLIGPNGAGKTTLLKLILGELQPDSGLVRQGTKLSVAYFDQFREQLDPEATLAETISPGSDFVEINGEKKHVISYLGDFLFPSERARSPVRSLSGGERNRLLLARLFTRPANVLVLDEPTNDLDIDTLELLESLLLDYAGTLFLVSHDRAFLDNVVTQVIAFEGAASGDGTDAGLLREYAGGYEDWLRMRPVSARPAEPRTAVAEKPKPRADKPAGNKLSFKETRELEALPGLIEAMEQEQAEITLKLGDSALYRDPEAVKGLQTRFAQLEEQLLEALERWESLEARRGG